MSSSSRCSSVSFSVCWWCMKRLRTASSSCSSRRWISRFIACSLINITEKKNLCELLGLVANFLYFLRVLIDLWNIFDILLSIMEAKDDYVDEPIDVFGYLFLFNYMYLFIFNQTLTDCCTFLAPPASISFCYLWVESNLHLVWVCEQRKHLVSFIAWFASVLIGHSRLHSIL